MNVARERVDADAALRDGRWHHVAAVVNQTQPNPQTLVYVDGRLQNSVRLHKDPLEHRPNLDQGSIAIARSPFLRERFLRGAIDELYWYTQP